MRSKFLFLLIFLLAIGGSASAQLVLPICSVNLPCPGFPLGSVQAPIDQNGWRNFKVTLTSNVTSFSFVGIPPSPAQAAVNIIFTQDAVGGRTVTFAAGISSPCTITLTASTTTLCQFEYDGTAGIWLGVGGNGGVGAGSGAAPLSGLNNGGIWQKMGTIINADPTNVTDQGTTQEASVICEASPQVLTVGETAVCGPPGTVATANAVLKMWFTCGYTVGHICYAEARPSHPMIWFRKSGTLIDNHEHGRVFKNGATYHEFAANSAQTGIDHYTSSDGIVWTLSASSVLGLGSAGQWDSLSIGNNRVWIEGSTWFMLYEAIKTAGQWSTGIATSTDGAGNVWTKNTGANPLCVGCGGPDKYKDVSGNYWIWTHSAPAGTSLPSDVFRWTSTNLNGANPTLTASPAISVLPRTTYDEGWQSAATGQLADVSHVEVNGSTLAFYEGSYDGNTQSAYLHLKLAVANLPWSFVVTTQEGVATSARSWDSSNGVSIGNPGIPGPTGGLFITNTSQAKYPGMVFQYQTTLANTSDQGFVGFNMLQTATGGTQRVSSTLTSARQACTIGVANSNAGCFLGMTNLAGGESFVYNAGFDSAGHVFDNPPPMVAAGTAPTITGTGACATIASPTGVWAGSFQCTGATAASTVTITWSSGIASHGFVCTAFDETTRANLLQQTSHSATTCVLTATSVTQNDVFVYTSFGF